MLRFPLVRITWQRVFGAYTRILKSTLSRTSHNVLGAEAEAIQSSSSMESSIMTSRLQPHAQFAHTPKSVTTPASNALNGQALAVDRKSTEAKLYSAASSHLMHSSSIEAADPVEAVPVTSSKPATEKAMNAPSSSLSISMSGSPQRLSHTDLTAVDNEKDSRISRDVHDSPDVASSIFDAVWRRLEKQFGRHNLLVSRC